MIKEIPFIQKQIISKLIGEIGLRYGEIKYEKDFDNDLFNYHLQALVKKGIVTKDKDSIYSLSEVGKKIITNTFPLSQFNKEKQKFRVNITTIVQQTRPDAGIYLHCHKRKRHPFYGDIGTTGGALEQGETLLEASKRTIFEKTGLTLINPEIVGCVRLVELYKTKVFQDLFLYIAYCDKFEGELVQENASGINEWASIEQMIKNETNRQTPSQTILNIFQTIKSGNSPTAFVFAEETFKLNNI